MCSRTDTDRGRAWYIPTAPVTIPKHVSRQAQPQTAPPVDPRHMRARGRGSRTDTDRGRAWYIPTAPVTHIGRAHTQTGAVPGTYPRPRSRAVRLILETLSGTPIDPPGAGRPNCEALEKKSHAEHAQETTRYGGLTRRAIGSLTSGPTSGTGKSAGRNFTNQGKTVYHMTSKETPPFL